MKLRNLNVGQKFCFVNGNGKIWQKTNNNADITRYNYCICIDDLKPAQKNGLMLISASDYHRMDKDSEAIIINN